MAIGRQWRETIAEALGMAEATVLHVERGLGGAGLVPRGARGRHVPHYDALHGGRLLIGSLAQGILAPATLSAATVAKVGKFPGHAIAVAATPEGSNQIVHYGRDGYPRDEDGAPIGAITVAPAGPFEEAVAGLLERLTDPETTRPVHAQVREVGVATSREIPWAWIKVGRWLDTNQTSVRFDTSDLLILRNYKAVFIHSEDLPALPVEDGENIPVLPSLISGGHRTSVADINALQKVVAILTPEREARAP